MFFAVSVALGGTKAMPFLAGFCEEKTILMQPFQKNLYEKKNFYGLDSTRHHG
jgi:hypothetical protein